MMLSMVVRTSFISFRFAPSTASPIGTPCPSVSRLRLTPLLPRSVGFRPVFFPPERCLRHRSIHAQPLPVDALQLLKLLDARSEEHTSELQSRQYLVCRLLLEKKKH